MVDSVSSVANLATALQMQVTAQNIDIAVLKKAQDIQEQQGQAVLALIDSANIANNAGEGVDVYV